ncbi:MAG TPA: hypothetical protein VN253_05385, partial [Kofleriaceae bacterium]|nr:hypothetical protein [Kofleriaceae bacterium]
MRRAFTRFIGVDLGGGRGKTTAVAEIRSGPEGAEVVEVATRSVKQPWTDETLVERLPGAASGSDAPPDRVGARRPDTVIAIDAPLTPPACNRCERPICPGMEACAEPAVVWLRTEGRALVRRATSVAVGDGPRPTPGAQARLAPGAQARLAPYAHR